MPDNNHTQNFLGKPSFETKINASERITDTIIICPASSPRLKLNNGNAIVCELVNIILMVFANPIPCMSPNDNASK